MAYNGSGVFNRIYSWIQDRNNGIPIQASRMDTEMDGFATGLTDCITKDGQSTPTANIPFGGFKLVNVGAATLATDAVNAGQIQGGLLTYYVDTGAADVYVITPAPAISVYAAGQSWLVKITNTNTTTTPTINVNGLGAKTIVLSDSTALTANILAASGVYRFTYDGTNMQVTGVVATGNVTTTGTQILTNKTLTSPKVNQILDTNGNESLVLTATASAVNEITVINNATGNYPRFEASGGDTNVGLDFRAKGTGLVRYLGTSTASAGVTYFEQTTNGFNSVTIKAPAAVTTDYTLTLPAAAPASKKGVQVASDGTVTFDGTSTIVQKVSAVVTATSTGATNTPFDDTIPQITEGNEFITVTITPINSSNILEIDFDALFGEEANNDSPLIVAIHQDATANALYAKPFINGAGSATQDYYPVTGKYRMVAGTTSATTFRLRAGFVTGTVRINGSGGGRKLGGAISSYLTVTEIAV